MRWLPKRLKRYEKTIRCIGCHRVMSLSEVNCDHFCMRCENEWDQPKVKVTYHYMVKP